MGVHETARRKAFKYKPKICEKCNLQKNRLDVHHIDGNSYNNKIENLMIVCSSYKRVNNIFNRPEWKNKMARTLQIKNMNGLVKRDEYGRFVPSNGNIKKFKEPMRNRGKKRTKLSIQKNSMKSQLKRNEKLLAFMFNGEWRELMQKQNMTGDRI